MAETTESTLGATLRRTRQALPSVRFSTQDTGAADRSSDSFGGGGILRNSQPSPSLNKKQTFFRNFFTQRNDDYRSDVPSVTEPPVSFQNPRTSQTQSAPGATQVSNASSSPDDDVATPKRWQRCLQVVGTVFRPSRATLDRMAHLISTRFWHLGLVFFTFLLLFGVQIQALFIPKEGDIAFDVLFTIALVVFVVDIFVRAWVEPQYFGFNFSGRNEEGPSAWGACRLCSFMFWCDLISTASLLYDISYINQRIFDVVTIDIEIEEYGLPVRSHFIFLARCTEKFAFIFTNFLFYFTRFPQVSGLEEVNRALPVALEIQLLVTIGRTARVARFIRASTVVKTSSKVNWYWLYQRMNPLWHWTNYRQSKSSRQKSSHSLDVDGATSELGYKPRETKNGVRGSWGGVQLGVMAAVKKAQWEEERKLDTEAHKLRGQGIVGFAKRMLRAVGLMRDDDEELRRQIAATKIQRVWRATVRQHGKAEQAHDGEDVAWVSRRDLVRDATITDSATQKRSILRQYNTSNKQSSFLSTGSKNSTARRSMLPMSVKNHIQARSTVGRRRPESQVGSAMRELTGQRVAIGIIVALVFTVLFTYSENDATRPSTMIVLHNQTDNAEFADASLRAARMSSIPDLYQYNFSNGESRSYSITGENPSRLRDREMLRITITDALNRKTVGFFAYRSERKDEALVELFSTIFILLVWFFGVTAFAGPVMTLVVIPIERMVRLLGMLMLDPLGYQSTPRYKKFVAEEDELTKNTRWTKEVLKGMETSFLMSTILRIGSLMKVGFGSAGVEIIRNNLERGQSKNMLILNSQGSTVSCIFLFCDIRQFTDATECLQEEVFVFTNRIAAVVHSICHAYGGSANKNIGDAFLLSWLLEDDTGKKEGRVAGQGRGMRSETKSTGSSSPDTFTAKSNQADKALLSVVKICMALHHDKFYIETMSETARDNLLTKLAKRKGPVVQMGFGLHAGKAVQGAIGSQRKIDATYVSESVERAEFLESSTKKYGLKMLMSDNFHRLLHPSNRRRCRKVDQILLKSEEDDDEEAAYGDVMELFTFDMDIDALWRASTKKTSEGEGGSDTESINESAKGSKREIMEKKASTRHVTGSGLLKGPRRRSMNRMKPNTGDVSSEEFKTSSAASEAAAQVAAMVNAGSTELGHEVESSIIRHVPPELVLPSGPTLYNANVWLSDDMRKIRELFSDGLFFQKFNAGLQSYYARDWEHAKQCFKTILERFDDGPSNYFLECIEKNNGIPPRNFMVYGTA
jgi:class 3 adenylate cyclase